MYPKDSIVRSSKEMSRAVVIHLEKAEERLPLVEKIRSVFPSLEVYAAKDGSAWSADSKIAKAHPWTKKPVTQGCIGCTHSHIDIIYKTLQQGTPSLILFEDDCEFTSDVTREQVTKYIHMANTLEKWDILLLGGTEYVESEPTSSAEYTKVGRFWGAHALILRERGMRAALKAFHASQKKGDFLPGDWLYNEAIRLDSLVCYGPTAPFRFCKQKEGLMSYLTGKPRTY
jgi:GR25 family glycosyltransferase involved in LPS biosynthesis